MVSTRHRGQAESEEDGSDRDVQAAGERERRRVDPVVKEAHKRGLDVDKLHGSKTPAWRNLRGRGGAQKRQSYFEGPEDEEDELADQPSEDDEEEDAEEAEEEEDSSSSESSEGEEEEQEDAPRYSRRVRQTVQRYSPPKDTAPPAAGKSSGGGGSGGGGRRRRYQEEQDDSDEEDGMAGLAQHNDMFAHRYSVRERRQVERFNPVAYGGDMGGSQQPTDSGAVPSRKRRERDDRKRQQQSDDSDAEEQQQERRQYSFRDRALVTIKPPSQQPSSQPQSGGGGLYHQGSGRYSGRNQHERKRPRHERRHGGSGRLHRTNSRMRLRDEDDVEDIPADHDYHPNNEGAIVAAGGHYYNRPGSAAGGGPPGAAAWDALQSAAANLGPLAHLGVGKEKAGNAEITPLQVDPSVTFDTVGGLDHYIKALKEMIFLPLVYPELFERFHIAPPRGVLFYGPPGTGKTLVARALAAHASRAGRKVSFFMRKGADVLSKWVGEAERQLRLLFEEAQRHQPSIIFFDEIDGLAPVRSSKQDQIHNSIVSTLLALMDGLDARGQVVVIGATNRVDALDGALRRPGRFDRELVFPLPNLTARADILRIHTSKWADRPSPELLEELASLCVGYCGADLKALCTEASLASLRRHYPQIYDADDKLLIDPGAVRVERRDFLAALQTITPASHRSAVAHARPLPPLVAPVLQDHMQRILAELQASFPAAAACLRSGFGGGRNPAASFSALADDLAGGSSSSSGAFSWAAAGSSLGVQRPRLLICGPEGSGQAHLGPSVLYALEGLPVHAIGLPSLLSDAGAQSPEEALVHAVVEARRAAPAVLFLPHLQVWWKTAPLSLRATLWMLLADLPADLPLLLFATADVPAAELDEEVWQLFNVQAGGAYQLDLPSRQQRAAFFKGIAEALAFPPPPAEEEQRQPAAALPALPRAPEAVAAEETAKKEAEELAARQRYEEDQALLRALRMVLRDLTLQLLDSRKWLMFAEPEEDPDWWDKVSEPMDLPTILSRVDARQYNTPHQYLADIALIVQCSREFWGTDPQGVREISRACALEDEARGAVAAAVPPELAARLEAMAARGGPAPPPPSMLAAAAPADGKTPGQHLLRRPSAVRPHSDDAAQRRATRHAGTNTIDNRLLHTDPEAAARHIRALKKQQEQLLQQQQQQQPNGAAATAAAAADGNLQDVLLEGADTTRQQQQQQPAEAPAAAEQDGEQAGGSAAQQAQQQAEREVAVLVESTKENLPEPAAAAAAVVAAATPVADAAATAAANAKQAKGTLTAVMQLHGASRLRREGSAHQPPQQSEPVAAAAEDDNQLQEQQPHQGTAQQQEAQGEQPRQQAAEPAAPAPAAAAVYEPTAADHARADKLQAALVQATEGLVLDNLESIHARLARLLVEKLRTQDREEVVQAALAAVRAWHAARQQA